MHEEKELILKDETYALDNASSTKFTKKHEDILFSLCSFVPFVDESSSFQGSR